VLASTTPTFFHSILTGESHRSQRPPHRDAWRFNAEESREDERLASSVEWERRGLSPSHTPAIACLFPRRYQVPYLAACSTNNSISRSGRKFDLSSSYRAAVTRVKLGKQVTTTSSGLSEITDK
jgi:hypothetical protein